jgi:type II secretion system protein D
MSNAHLKLIGAVSALTVFISVSQAQNAAPAPAASAPKTPAVSTNAASPRNIRFQFDGIPYSDVVERFAQMSGKPLVANTNIQGTLSYNDPKTYTYEEALDVLNIILAMKDVMLVESGNHLQLVPFKQLPQQPLKILRGTDRTGDVRPGEVVTVVLDLKSLDAKEVADSIVPMLSNAGSVAPLSRGRGLILTDRLQHIERIKFLLAQIDIESSSKRQMKTFALLHSSGAVVTDLINRTFGVATAPKRTQYNSNSKQLDTLPPDPSDYVTAVYDDASRTLVLFGPPARIELAEDLISRFEDKDGPNAGDVRIYYPQTIKAEDLANTIRQAIPGVAAPGETAAAAATKARVIADAAQNRLIVSAPVGSQLDEIERLINKVDKPIHGTGGFAQTTKSEKVQITKVFRPRSAEPAAVAKILSEALSRRSTTGMMLPTANVSVEPLSASVVVTGSPGDVQTAVDIITQLETGSTMPVPQQTKFIDVGTVADAKRLSPLVEQIYRSQVTDSIGGQVAHAKIMADAESGRLIVTASDDHLKRIETIVSQVRAQTPKRDARTLRIVPLKHLRADTALASVTGLVTDRMAERRFEDSAKPSLVSDPVNNRLLVTATEEQFKEIEQVIRIVDIAPEAAKREMAILPVQSKPAAELITLVSQLLGQFGDAQNNPELAPKLIADPSGKQIIAMATAKDMERIRGLVQQLDTATAVAATRQFKGVDLFSRTAAEFAPLVQQLYSEQLRGFPEPAGGAATVIAEAKNNRLMVSGPDKEITRVEAIIRQLDPAEKRAAKEETRVIRLRTGVAGDLATLVEKSVNAQSQQVRVMVDARSNSLVVNGQPEAVESAAQIISQLDTRGETGPREMRILDLRSGDATTLAPMVTSLFTDMTREQRGPNYVPETKIVADAGANRLIVSGSRDEITQVAKLVQQLDQTPEQSGSARVFQLQMASAMTLAPIVSNAMLRFDARGLAVRKVIVAADEKSNSLIVTGGRADVQDASVIISRLDGENSGAFQEEPRDLRIIQVNTSDPDQLAGLTMRVFAAQNLGRNITNILSITPEPSGKRLVVLAPKTLLAQVEQVVMSLDQPADQAARELHSIDLKNASAQDIFPTVSRIYGEQSAGKSIKPASIYPDASGTRLTVWGTKDQAAGIRQIIDTLESQARPPRETRGFDVGSAADVQRLVPIVQQLYQDQWRGKGDPADAQIVSDARAGRIIVSGKPEHIKQIEEILKHVRASGGASSVEPIKEARETRVYDLTTANAMELATTVRTLYTEQAKFRLGTLAPETLIMSDASANRLIVTGDTTELAAIEEIVQKLDKIGAQSASTRVFKLKSADPDKVMEILSNALVRYDAYGRQQRRVSVSVDAKTRTIIATGDPKDLQGASVIIEQLDTSLGAQPERKMKVVSVANGRVADLGSKLRQLYADQMKGHAELGTADALIMEDASSNQFILAANDGQLKLLEDILTELQSAQASQTPRDSRIYDLTTASALELATTVRTLYQEQAKARPGAPVNEAVIMPDAGSNRLIVSAATNELDVIEEIVKKLDKISAQSASTRVFKLKSADPDKVIEILSAALVRYDAYGRPQKRATVVADPKTRTLIATGEAKDLQSVAVIVEQMDAVGASEDRQMRIIVLKSGVASDVSRKLQQVYIERLKGKGDTADALILGDDASNRLIVTATEPHLKLIEEIVKQFEQGGEGAGRQMRVIGLQKQSAASVAAMISQLFARQVQSTEAGARLTVTASPDDRTLVIDGPTHTFSEVEELVKTLDKALTDSQGTLHTVQLKNAQADDVAQGVQRVMFGRGAQNRLQRVGISAIDGANSLLINGPDDAVQEVLKIVHELDKESEDGEIKVRIYKLENGNVREVQGVLNQVMQGVTVAQRRRNGRAFANLSTDERSNTIIVTGSEAHFKVIEQLLQTLDKVPEKGDRDVQFVWLKNARAVDVATKLDAVFAERPAPDRPVVEADVFANSVTLIGRPADVAQAQEIIAKLDETSKDSSVQVRLRPIDRLPAEQMARMLQNIYPQMSAGKLKLVEKLEITNTNAVPATTNAASATNAQTLAEVVIAVDKEANALILSGPANELDQIDRIVSELSFSFISNDAEFRLIALKEADPIVVARTINQLFRIDPPPQQNQQQQQQQQPQPARPNQEPRITVVAEPRTRSVIVRAKPADFTLIENLIKQLDSSQITAQLDYRVVALTNAAPEKVLPLVQEMVQQLRQVRPGDPVTVAIDGRSHGLLVVARGPVMDEVEKMIRSLDTPSAYSEAEVLVVSLKKANASQLSAILQNMLKPGAQGELTAEARELQEQIRRLKVQGDNGQTVSLDLTKPIKIMSDPATGGQGGNRLVLTSTSENLKALAAVVAMMDTVALSEGVDVKIVRLERADADAVAQTLTAVFSQGQRLATGPGGAVEPEGSGKALVNPLNVALDGRNNALILSGRKETLELAEKIIEDLDREMERFITEVRLFQLKYANAVKVLPLLQAVFAEGPAVPGSAGLQTQVTRLRTALDGAPAKTTDQPRSRAALVMQADESANVIIAAARSDMLPLIEDVLKQLDVPTASGLSMVRLFALKHADPQVVQKVINDLYAGPRATTVRAEDKPTVTIDDRTGTLIVASTERTFAIIESLLASLDKELALEMRDIRILSLQHADASELAAQLQRLLDARVTQKTAMGRTQAETMRVLIVAEPRSNSLLIGGSQDSFELVQALATQLDKAPTALSGKIRQVTLQYADARNLATSLNQLFTQRYQSSKSPEMQRNKPIIIPDPRGNALLIGAGMDDNAVIDELLTKLDRKLDDPALQLGVLALKHNDSAKMAATIENIFTARLQSRTPPGEQPSPQDRVKIETDPLNNALIVSASRENLELIQTLLQKLDVEPTVPGGVLTTFTLQFADAQRVATILRTLVDQGLYRPGAIITSGASGSGRATGGRDALAISVDPRSNTLIVSASPENLAVVRTVISQVDTKDFAELGNVRLYPLKKARAASLATVLEQFFRAKQQGEATAVNAAERRVPVTIVPDERSNALLVTGTKEGFDVIERLLLQLDGDDAQARLSFRVFALKQATATKLQDTLRQLFVNRPPRVKGETPEPITVVADSWVNALIVGAAVDDMGMVASLVERLDSEQGGPGLAVQVFPLAKADARKIAQTIQGLYREGTSGTTTAQPVSVTADDRINAIVVSAGEADVKRISELVKKLDTDQVARVAEIRVFALRYARAETLSGILNTALNTKAAALTDGNPNAQSVLQFIARNGDGNELVTSALKEGVLITPDSRVNSLIVSAPVDYMDLLAQIITKLDNSSYQKAKIKVFTLLNADARQTAEVLAGLFRLQPAPGQNGVQRSIQYTLVKTTTGAGSEIPGETDVATAILGTDEQSALNVTIDPRTNSLLIGGTEDHVSLVSQIIDSLDSSEAQERKTKVYRLRNAQAQEVGTAIRTFLDQERQKVAQVLGADAVGTAQRMLEREIAVVAEPVSNTLLISASPRYFESVLELIEELDQPQAQVLIQVLVAEVSLDSALDLGLEWTYNGIPFAAGIEISEAAWIETGFSSAVTGGDYSFLFRALEDKGRLEVLSRPQIVTADNKPASINIGQTIPLITDSRVTERGDTINSFRYQNVGVNLRVTPRISPDGFVQLEVGTTNSTVSSASVQINNNATVPIINERVANTTVSVQSGQSILIGGLIGTLDDKRVRKVPYLSDIPLIGYLFRSNRNRQERRELLILLTPQVLEKPEVVEKKTFHPREVTDEQLRKSRIKDEIKRDEVQKQILDPLFPPDEQFEKGKSLPKPEPLPIPNDSKP